MLSTSHQLQVTGNERKEESLQVVQGTTLSCTVKNVLFWPKWTQRPDMTWLSCNALSTVTPHFLDGLTLHSSPWLQSGLRQNELWRRLRQDVVAKYLLGRRRRGRRHAHCVQKHWSALLVLRPNWWRVVEVLEASRDLNREKDWKGNRRLEGDGGEFPARVWNTICPHGRNQWYFPF